jgi:hypothetical protein
MGPHLKMRPPYVLAVSLVLGGTIGLAQKSPYPIYTADHLTQSMKTVGLAFGLADHAIGRNDYENAKDYLIRARDAIAPSITFWRDRKLTDAVAMLRDTLKKMDALDTAMSAEAVDARAVADLARQVSGSCDACHVKYREQDPATKLYRVKPELLR